MEMDVLLNMVFAAVISGLGWWIKSQHDEIKRVTILLNRTREEMSKEYVTKSDSNQVLLQIMNKFDRLRGKNRPVDGAVKCGVFLYLSGTGTLS